MRISSTWLDFERLMMKASPDCTVPGTLELPSEAATPQPLAP
jgi:hypothetical protein